MLGRSLVLLLLVPVVELYLLVAIGKVIGGLATFGLVLASAMLGAALAKGEGRRVIRSWQAATERGEMPKADVVSSLLVVAAGVLFIVPGVLTDLVGALLVVPPVRRRVAAMLTRALARRFQVATLGGPGMVFGMDASAPEGDVIDATAVEVERDDDAPRSGGRAATPSLPE